MGCLNGLNFARHFFFGIVLGTFNLISSVVNIYYLFSKSHQEYGIISLFLLWFPGLVTSVSFLILYARGNKTILRLVWWKVLVYPVALLLFYPVVPILLTLHYLISRYPLSLERAIFSKYFTAFLDHGPHFVLRLVIVVLQGIAEGGTRHRHDTIFVLSMVSSFLSLIYTALWFNERRSTWLQWIFLAGPMYSAIFACRAFTLAVLLKTTLNDSGLQIGAFLLLIGVMATTNFALFKACGQDWTRSAVFGIASLLLPAGYKNDTQYYQVPKQDILESNTQYELVHVVRAGGDDQLVQLQEEGATKSEGGAVSYEEPSQKKALVPMSSAKFLLLHVIFNTLLIGLTGAYIFISRRLDTGSNDALIIPQVLGIVPGLFFAVGTSFLMPGMCPSSQGETNVQKVCVCVSKGAKVCLAILFSILGFLSIIPALFWTFIYKWITGISQTFGEKVD